MGVDQTSLDRIRNATFPSTRRGYDKQEVEKFLARLADWLETGGGDESRSETVKRELERVGERTGAILSQAEDSAQQIRVEAEEEARSAVDTANAEADQTRTEADAYSQETRTAADAYSEESRKQADSDSAAAIADAQAKARRIVEEGTRRRQDIEAVISDLVRRRDDVLNDTETLSTKLTAAVTEHRPAEGSDPFDVPDELDPAAREDLLEDVEEEEVEVEGEAELEDAESEDLEELEDEEATDLFDAEADADSDETLVADADDDTAEAPSKQRKGQAKKRSNRARA